MYRPKNIQEDYLLGRLKSIFRLKFQELEGHSFIGDFEESYEQRIN